MPHLDDLLAGAEVVLADDILDRIDEVVAPGTMPDRWGRLTNRPP